MRTEELLQGCSNCDPRHPISIHATAILLSRLEEVDLTWYLADKQSLGYLDDFRLGSSDTGITMPVLMLSQETRFNLLREAAKRGQVVVGRSFPHKNVPTITLEPQLALVSSFFDTTYPIGSSSCRWRNISPELLRGPKNTYLSG
jgi:hypothetical protein